MDNPTPGREQTQTATLGQLAIQSLQHALEASTASAGLLREERSIRQPDSWLVEQCWSALARTRHAEAALVLASLIAHRQPLAVSQALLALAQQAHASPNVAQFVRKRLHQHAALLWQHTGPEPATYRDNLLLVSVAAAKLGLSTLVFSCLERLDQLPGTWQAIMRTPEQRLSLATAIAAVPLHPLPASLLDTCLERFELDGALFLNELSALLVTETGDIVPGRGRTLQRCIKSIEQFVSGDMMIRRCTTNVLARAGEAQAVLESLDILASIMEAQAEAAPTVRDADDNILRQVVRTGANRNVDFQVFVLQEALRALPAVLRTGPEAQILAERLAGLAGRSDGWTVSGAIAVLVDAGWLETAAELVHRLDPGDAARSDALCMLVQGLLAQAQWDQADAQVRQAWPWIMQLPDEHVKWLTVRRLAELYVEADRPRQGLALMHRRTPTRFWHRLLRSREKVSEERRLGELRVRLLCLMADRESRTGEEKALMHRLMVRAPALLEGEALATFYLSLLPSLIAAGRWHHVTDLLPGIHRALIRIKGQRHAVRTREMAGHLARCLALIPHREKARLARILQQWLMDFWARTRQDGIWQAVYSIDGCLELILALEGAQPVLAIGRFAQNANRNLAWDRTIEAAVQEMTETL